MLASVRRRGGTRDDRAAGALRGRFAGPLFASAVLVVVLAATLLTVAALRASRRETAADAMDRLTALARETFAAAAARNPDQVQTVAAGVGTAGPRFNAADFAAATAPLASAGLAGASSVSYIVPASAATAAATQRYWRQRGATGLRLVPRGEQPEHYFAVFERTLGGSGPGAAGTDFAASPEASAALAEARRTGRATVSDAYVQSRDGEVPAGEPQRSFLFAAPVYSARTGEPREFSGWVALGVDAPRFVKGVASSVSQGLLSGQLFATNGEGRLIRVGTYQLPGQQNLARQAVFPVADKRWTMHTSADSELLQGAGRRLPVFVLTGGLALALMGAVLAWVLATGRSRARVQVELATAGLRTAEAESRRQAGLLGAIMDSLGDGVGVIDQDGAFLLHNPAARKLLGVTDDVAGPANWQQHYGLFRPDGREPFPVEEMPLVRALHGESTDGVEMLVRNPGRPEGILLSVDGRPLDADAAGQPGAVAVFRDITELRRYERDLAVFAGVVAHDLKAPLAVIRGHCETAVDDLSDAPQGPEVVEVRAALDRIAGAVDRMAALIDTLLAYTTSRDARLKLTTVPLGSLVADVVEHRVGQPRSPGVALPEITVGPLPEVVADPGMLRHVIDNLVGNSMKYVPAGQRARIEVTAAPGQPGWTSIEIADRGIGIPDEDKPKIFEAFHRSRSAAGYSGTGLGLAICRRIVERHGGTIEVTDNPGGGTCFAFTLPLAATGVEGEPDQAALDRVLAERAAVEESARAGSEIGPAATAAPRPHPSAADRPGPA
jgi:PAS domain S-box-containing protein